MKRINLDAILAETVGEVELFGRVFGVRTMDGAGYQTMNEVEGGTPTQETFDAQFAIARRHLTPALTDEEFSKLTPKAVGVINAVAAGMGRAVESQLPNSLAPTTTSPSSAPTSESSANASVTGSPGVD